MPNMNAEQAATRTGSRELFRSVLRVGITIVLLALSAGITIPIQPVPFTLQILVLGIAVAVLSPREAITATAGYVAIGALGAPVFSGYMGGMVKLLGPSGGFIFGFVAGAAVGTLLRVVLERTSLPKVVTLFSAIVVAIAVSYVFGWAQLMLVAHLSPAAAFAAGCAPFILIDLSKAALATAIAYPLGRFFNPAK